MLKPSRLISVIAGCFDQEKLAGQAEHRQLAVFFGSVPKRYVVGKLPTTACRAGALAKEGRLAACPPQRFSATLPAK